MCLAVPGQIVRITSDEPMARIAAVQFGGVMRDINISLVPDAAVGDYILAHVGIAISRIDEVEAKRVFDHLERIDEIDVGPPTDAEGDRR